ncbi:hypothetical protein [Kitasatospora sp. NPDC059571]|uniref:hypothetical protein n=1 Tax=Kitasatospora sp. NPDC059571 TaxID=3346871 RepID=UPI00368A9966
MGQREAPRTTGNSGERIITHHRIRRTALAALLGAAVLSGSGCSIGAGAPDRSGPSAAATVTERPLPADAIVPKAGADLCTLLGSGFLTRYAPDYTLDDPRHNPLMRPEYRILNTDQGGTGPELAAGGCQVSNDGGLGGLGVTFTRELPGPDTGRSPEDRCALVAKDRHDREAAETESLDPAFTFEDMPALGPGGFRELEVRDGKVLMARTQGCRGADWIALSVVPGPHSDNGRAANDAVEALQDIYRRLGDV